MTQQLLIFFYNTIELLLAEYIIAIGEIPAEQLCILEPLWSNCGYNYVLTFIILEVPNCDLWVSIHLFYANRIVIRYSGIFLWSCKSTQVKCNTIYYNVINTLVLCIAKFMCVVTVCLFTINHWVRQSLVLLIKIL